MAMFAIGDTHLSLNSNKPMTVFPGWDDYVERLEKNWRALVAPEDTVVICGDISWAMSLDEALTDFTFLHGLPGTKLLLKGNHDYWWETAAKMHAFFEQHELHTLHLLHNNCAFYGDYALCGTRGWFRDEETADGAHNRKVLNREVMRLETSLRAAGDRPILCFLHYPPLYSGYSCPEILEVLQRYQVKACCYGHLHGPSHRLAIEGERCGIDFSLVSADYLDFQLKKICE